MHTLEEHLLTKIIVTGDDTTPPHERIERIPMVLASGELTIKTNPITGEIYIPTPFIVSYISGHYMRQYMQAQPARTAW